VLSAKLAGRPVLNSERAISSYSSQHSSVKALGLVPTCHERLRTKFFILLYQHPPRCSGAALQLSPKPNDQHQGRWPYCSTGPNPCKRAGLGRADGRGATMRMRKGGFITPSETAFSALPWTMESREGQGSRLNVHTLASGQTRTGVVNTWPKTGVQTPWTPAQKEAFKQCSNTVSKVKPFQTNRRGSSGEGEQPIKGE
jgi:hypothetical protein